MESSNLLLSYGLSFRESTSNEMRKKVVPRLGIVRKSIYPYLKN